MIFDNYEQFIDRIFSKLKGLSVDVSGLQMDHIGYQASSDGDYDRLKVECNRVGELVSEELVGGRRVGIYKLFAPLHYCQHTIPAIELLAPRENQGCSSALEHVEFVIHESFNSFMKKYPKVPWDISKLNRPMFPMITLKLTDTTQVKFHLKSVLDIVKQTTT